MTEPKLLDRYEEKNKFFVPNLKWFWQEKMLFKKIPLKFDFDLSEARYPIWYRPNKDRYPGLCIEHEYFDQNELDEKKRWKMDVIGPFDDLSLAKQGIDRLSGPGSLLMTDVHHALNPEDNKYYNISLMSEDGDETEMFVHLNYEQPQVQQEGNFNLRPELKIRIRINK